jgi:uncharacterized protein (TIGR02145 family)/uncharacterized repeat protein (TIGR02543 family)
MKKTILYAITAAVTATAAIAIVGCGEDFGSGTLGMNGFLERLRYSEKDGIGKGITKFSITYNGNGHTGGNVPKDNYSPYDSGTVITVLNHGDLKKNGYVFAGWNTRMDGTGDSKNEGGELRLLKNDTLYARWEDEGIYLNYVTVVTSPITGTGASGSGRWPVGRVITVNAGTADGYQFNGWIVTGDGVTLDSANSATTTFKMPNNDVLVTAMFVALPGAASWFNDSRDGKTYRSVTIGEQTWMAQNLNFETPAGSRCYDNNADSCNKYGRLYDWATAMGIDPEFNDTLWIGGDVNHQGVCPGGWHLPSKAEMDELVMAVGRADWKLKSTHGWGGYNNGTDEYGFSALPGGWCKDYCKGGGNDESYWWTATNYNFTAFVLKIHNGVMVSGSEKRYNYSVRCVLDD